MVFKLPIFLEGVSSIFVVQREVIEDKYPIILVNGLRIVVEISKFLHDSDEFKSLDDFLNSMDVLYPTRLKQRQAEEILNA